MGQQQSTAIPHPGHSYVADRPNTIAQPNDFSLVDLGLPPAALSACSSPLICRQFQRRLLTRFAMVNSSISTPYCPIIARWPKTSIHLKLLVALRLLFRSYLSIRISLKSLASIYGWFLGLTFFVLLSFSGLIV